ncbi:spore coat protein [Caldicoprobacter faecalis]|uniref:Coat F domain-containing protein n=1 Tax=Caldicoprobacter faecalis TaxID=937334 RepID=A0A1I5UPX2_9FIRM|nr:spore coat protein [Caldicoprobacter faecalis]SFP97248.1 Coat F domain-containing protein [Caldicoprobacter faecalis]
MREKDMVNDVLSMLKSSITTYANIIAEAENPQFRQMVQQLRNNCETFQYDLFNVAKQKGYYQPAKQASPADIQEMRSQFMMS